MAKLPSLKAVDDKSLDVVRRAVSELPPGAGVSKLHKYIQDHHGYFITTAVIRACKKRLESSGDNHDSEAGPSNTQDGSAQDDQTNVVVTGTSDTQAGSVQDQLQDTAVDEWGTAPAADEWAAADPETTEDQVAEEAAFEEPEPPIGDLPDLSYLTQEDRDFLASKSRVDESGKRLLPGASRKMSTLLFVSSSVDGNTFSEPRPSTNYVTESVSKVGGGFPNGPRDLFSFRNQQYGYGGVHIDHGMVHTRGPKARLVTFATTDFDMSVVKYVNGRAMTKAEYLTYCRQHGFPVEDSDREEVWLLDIIASTSKYYFATQNFGVDTLAEKQVPGHDEAIQATMTSMQCPSPYIRLHLFFVGYSQDPRVVSTLMSAGMHVLHDGPYAYLLRHAEDGHRLPSIEHMVSPADCAFRTPDSEVYRFKDRAERTVRLAYGTREEEAFQTNRVALAYKRPQQAFALDLSLARVRNPFTQKEEATHCVIVIPRPTDLDLMPAIGESAKILTDIPITYKEAPHDRPTKSQLIDTLTGIIVQAAKIARQVNVGKEKELPYLLAAVDRILRPCIKEEEANRARFVRKQATDLQVRRPTEIIQAEDDQAHKERVAEWVKQYLDYLYMPPKDCADFALFSVTRQSPNPGFEDCLIFHAEYPRNELSHTDPQPYIPVDIPFVPMPRDVDVLKTYRKDTKRYGFMATVIRFSSEMSVDARLAGISYTDPASEDRPTIQKYLDWLLDFAGDTVPHDLYTLFPSLAHLRDRVAGKTAADSTCYAEAPSKDIYNEPDDGRHVFFKQVTFTEAQSNAMLQIYNQLDADQRSMFENLEARPFGSFLLSGCPGGGKSHTAGALVTLACLSRVPTTSWNRLLRPVENKSPDLGEEAVAGTGKPVLVSYNDDIDLQEPENYEHPRDIPFGLSQYKTFRKSFALVLGTQNDQLDVMAKNLEEFHDSLPFRRPFITRAATHAMTTERLSRHMGDDELTPEHATEDNGMRVDEAFETALQFERMHQSAKSFRDDVSESRFSVPFQVAELLREGKLTAAIRANDLRQEKQDSPDEFHDSESHKLLQQALRELVEYVYLRSDFILATPFVANSLVSKLKYSPAIVWIDEAWRMAEPDALIGLAGFPEALIRIQSGDAVQLAPLCMSLHAHKTKDKDRWLVNRFGPQFATSLPKRAMHCGHEVTYLMKNWRATNGLSVWASDNCYSGRMVEGVPEDYSPEMERLSKYLLAIKPDGRGKRLVFQINHAMERSAGTSYINTTHGVFIRELVASIFANRLCTSLPTETTDGRLMSIMIISPYDQQVQLLRAHVNHLSKAEWDKSLVKFRTVDSAMGAEADIVIYSNPRTEGAGFTAYTERMNVAHTRARKAEFVIMSDRLTRGTSLQTRLVRDFWNAATMCNAIVTYEANQWDLCKDCFTKHMGKNRRCIRCSICNGDHPVRKCRLGQNVPSAPAKYQLPPIAEDVYTKMLQTRDVKDNNSNTLTAGHRRALQTARERLGLEDVTASGQDVAPLANLVHINAAAAETRLAPTPNGPSSLEFVPPQIRHVEKKGEKQKVQKQLKKKVKKKGRFFESGDEDEDEDEDEITESDEEPSKSTQPAESTSKPAESTSKPAESVSNSQMPR